MFLYKKLLIRFFIITIDLSAVFCFAAACSSQAPIIATQAPENSKYNVDTITHDWHDRVKKNPNNPYENNGYSGDNDTDYAYPTRRVMKNAPRSAPAPVRQQPSNPSGYKNMPAFDDNNDANYGRFPKYNPDDDNQPINSKNYPLYLD